MEYRNRPEMIRLALQDNPEALLAFEELYEQLDRGTDAFVSTAKRDLGFGTRYVAQLLKQPAPDTEIVKEIVDNWPAVVTESKVKGLRLPTERYVLGVKALIATSNFDGILTLTEDYRRTFAEPNKYRICGTSRTTCTNRGCNYRFESVEVWECPVCGSTRRLCRQKSRSNGRCGWHSGRKTVTREPYGDENLVFVGGKGLRGFYMKDERLGNLLSQYAEDERYTSQRLHMSILSARIQQLVEDVGSVDPRTLQKVVLKKAEYVRRRVRMILGEILIDQGEGDGLTIGSQTLDKFIRLMREVDEAMIGVTEKADALLDDLKKWDQILEAIEIRRRAAETEVKNAEKIQQMVSVNTYMQTMTRLTTAFVRAVQAHVNDPDKVYEIRRAIARDIERQQDVVVIDGELME